MLKYIMMVINTYPKHFFYNTLIPTILQNHGFLAYIDVISMSACQIKQKRGI